MQKNSESIAASTFYPAKKHKQIQKNSINAGKFRKYPEKLKN
jgi:hypothetical protein